ncbi:MAG: glutamate racemase [Gammaproteobacteria bacterium]|nr:glutamate racemase [Gammaproteobacteria bacterium]
MDRNAPVGLFDSGIGGWTVLREIRRELPAEALLYVADAAGAPYGDRPPEFIAARALAIAHWLRAAGAKALVVACNTATSAAVAQLRDQHTVPIVAIEPAVKPAALLTRSGIIGVLATSLTVASGNFSRLRDAHGGNVTILAQACPGLVEQVEAGALDAPHTRDLLNRYVAPLLAQGADTLVLACTHFPWLAPMLRELVGSEVVVVDPAPAVARELRRRLTLAALLAPAQAAGNIRAVTTGDPQRLREQLARLGEVVSEIVGIALPLSGARPFRQPQSVTAQE